MKSGVDDKIDNGKKALSWVKHQTIYIHTGLVSS